MAMNMDTEADYVLEAYWWSYKLVNNVSKRYIKLVDTVLGMSYCVSRVTDYITNQKRINTMTDYNGWTNQETWIINLWMGDYFQDVANEGQHLMADYIEETVWDMLDDSNVPPMFKDMIDLGAVNWAELADHYVTAEEVA